jgi:LacI family transcriptional regulator
MATIRDVARQAGVSTATVSYVLNGRASVMRITDETKERILRAVSDLSYHPNALARGLARKQSNTIAIVMQFPALFSRWSGFTNDLMRGVTDAAIEAGIDVMMHTRAIEVTPDETPGSRAAKEVAALTDGRADGALLLRDLDDPLASALSQNGFPAVLMFTRSPDPVQWFIDCDNVCGADMATKHLLEMGHSRIVHLAGSLHSAPVLDRKEGFIRALREAGIAHPQAWVVEEVYPASDFSAAVAPFTRPKGERPTAVFAWSDDVAMHLLQELRGIGLSVPRDVAIVGFDSTVLCDHMDPPLTSVRQPVYDMAKEAVRMLCARIAGEPLEERRRLVPPTLDIRKSCGASLVTSS